MKKFLLSLMALGCMTVAQGQTDVWTATLQHGDEVTVFRMANALSEAYNAAVDGDVITLSEGTFNAVHINKAITIYGAGFEVDETTGTRVTTINGGLNIGNPNDTISVHIEGCNFDRIQIENSLFVKNALVKNCCMNNVIIKSDVGDIEFFNDVIKSQVWGQDNALTSMQINNCYVAGRIYGFPAFSPIIVDHCVLNGSYVYNSSCNGAYYYTNDVFTANSPSVLDEESNVRNCLFYHNGVNLSNLHAENCYLGLGTGIFTDSGNGTYDADRTWELQQPEVWIGTDGTQIGLYGGKGWSKVPRIPVINSLELNVQGDQLLINYDAEVRE